MEKPVRSPRVPPIRPNCASVVTFMWWLWSWWKCDGERILNWPWIGSLVLPSHLSRSGQRLRCRSGCTQPQVGHVLSGQLKKNQCSEMWEERKENLLRFSSCGSNQRFFMYLFLYIVYFSMSDLTLSFFFSVGVGNNCVRAFSSDICFCLSYLASSCAKMCRPGCCKLLTPWNVIEIKTKITFDHILFQGISSLFVLKQFLVEVIFNISIDTVTWNQATFVL